ncbi:MAG: FHA domain-containing protein [Anaerolineae bacterium]|jgi:hypothetical protein|nr:FHA domain-containing protein [Anaerolineae bacterium]MDH7472635.1 DUF3662 and FHA domain-containing protein [Anaerolineae bacterium]
MNKLSRFEALAETLVEGAFARLLHSRLQPVEVAQHIARAMEDGQIIGPEGGVWAPNHYWVFLNPADHAALHGLQPSLETELANYVVDLARRGGVALHTRPVVQIRPSEEVPPHRVQVEARFLAGEQAVSVEPGMTQELPIAQRAAVVPQSSPAPAEKPQPPHCTLHYAGCRIPITEPLVSLGRSLDNDIIVSEPQVSRRHAQLRRRYGRYTLYDLGSSGGTTVNGQPVQECALADGDVIALAGVELVFEAKA